jgi:sporulation protein YlmC with PRC-barrel domain
VQRHEWFCTELKATGLREKEVIVYDGRLIGKVKDGEIDDKTWQIKTLDVQLEGNVAKEFHLKKTFGSTTVPIDTKFVGAVGDKVVLKGSAKEVGDSINAAMESPPASQPSS